jgi:hypothetical protein
MTVQNKETLKGYYNTGDIPSEANFADLIDSIGPRTATLYVAASNATDAEKANADYVCDGTDDHVEINTALAALPAAGGKLVLSTGLFVTGAAVVIDKRITLEGMGAGLSLPDGSLFGSTVGITTIRGGGAFDVIQVDGATKLQGCSISRLMIQGSAKDNGCAGIYTHDTDLISIRDVSISFCQYGLHMVANDAGKVDHVSAQGCTLGLYLEISGNAAFDNFCASACVGDATLLAGCVYMTGCSLVRFNTCLFDTPGAYNNILIAGNSSGTSIVNCYVSKAGLSGIVLGDSTTSADRTIIMGCHIHNNGQLSATDANGISIFRGRFNVVTGNQIFNTPSVAGTQVNAVKEEPLNSWSDYSTVTGNVFLGNLTAGYVKSGANSIDANNITVAP